MAPVLQLKGLSVGYEGVPVLEGLTFQVDRGELLALIGPNGAGKSTTLLSIAGFLRTLRGEVLIDGASVERVTGYRRSRRGVRLMPEGRSIISGLTVDENFKLVRNPKIDPYEVFPRLQKMKNRRAGLCSGGEQQMIALGRALSASPKLLLVDELSLGLAPTLVEQLLPVLRLAAKEHGIAVVFVEQNVEDALALADRVVVVANGAIRAAGSGKEMHAQLHEIETAFFGEVD